jgi:hypothetical protein
MIGTFILASLSLDWWWSSLGITPVRTGVVWSPKLLSFFSFRTQLLFAYLLIAKSQFVSKLSQSASCKYKIFIAWFLWKTMSSVMPNIFCLFANENAGVVFPLCVSLSWAPGGHISLTTAFSLPWSVCHAHSGGGSGTKSNLGKKSLFLPGGWANVLTFPGQHH